MKVRTDFVTNSSSSQFILLLENADFCSLWVGDKFKKELPKDWSDSISAALYNKFSYCSSADDSDDTQYSSFSPKDYFFRSLDMLDSSDYSDEAYNSPLRRALDDNQFVKAYEIAKAGHDYLTSPEWLASHQHIKEYWERKFPQEKYVNNYSAYEDLIDTFEDIGVKKLKELEKDADEGTERFEIIVLTVSYHDELASQGTKLLIEKCKPEVTVLSDRN